MSTAAALAVAAVLGTGIGAAGAALLSEELLTGVGKGVAAGAPSGGTPSSEPGTFEPTTPGTPSSAPASTSPSSASPSTTSPRPTSPRASRGATRSPSPSTSSTPAIVAAGDGTHAAEEAEVLRLVNAERAAAGCQPLAAHATLVTVARTHSADMAVNGYFDHTGLDGRSPFERMNDAGYVYSDAGENIAAGQQTPTAVMQAWMTSSGHRANILNCTFTEIGIGRYAKVGSEYGVYWTQLFGRPL